MLMINTSNCSEILYAHGYALPQFIHKNMVIERNNYRNFVQNDFKEFIPEMFRNKEHVVFIRQYALGDILQLVYVARKFKAFYNVKNVTIACAQSFLAGLNELFPDIRFIIYDIGETYKADVVMMLDGNLERDHSLTNTENNIHRINIFNQNLGMPFDSKTTSAEWAFKEAEEVKFEGEPNVKYVGLQIRGSSPIKTLPIDYIVSLAKELSKEYRVVLLDHDAKRGFDGDNILNLCGKLNVHQCITLISHLSAIITMDSGMLWMAHSAAIPTICILGSTREEERVSLHPLFPEKAKSISLSNMVNCKPCFETRIACKGKHFCMNNFPREHLTDTIRVMLKQIIGDESNGKNEQAGHRESVESETAGSAG